MQVVLPIPWKSHWQSKNYKSYKMQVLLQLEATQQLVDYCLGVGYYPMFCISSIGPSRMTTSEKVVIADCIGIVVSVVGIMGPTTTGAARRVRCTNMIYKIKVALKTITKELNSLFFEIMIGVTYILANVNSKNRIQEQDPGLCLCTLVLPSKIK